MQLISTPRYNESQSCKKNINVTFNNTPKNQKIKERFNITLNNDI